MTGWIKLHRKVLDSSIFSNPHLLKMWMWCLLKASHKGYKQMIGLEEIELKEGQFVTGRNKGSAELNVNPSTWYKHLKVLEKMKMIELESNNKMTVVSVVNWSVYQGSEIEKEQPNNNQITTKEQQSNTNKNVKNVKNEKNSLCMYDEKLKNVVNLLENNIGVIPPILINEISDYTEKFNIDMFSEAIKIASSNKKRTVNYVLGILRNWQDNNIIEINDLNALREEKKIERDNNKKTHSKPKAYKTRFHNFEGRTENYNNKQLEGKMERKRQEARDRMKELGSDIGMNL